VTRRGKMAVNIAKLRRLSVWRVEIFSDAGHIPNADQKIA
jgi:hypothetical protein